MLYNPKEDDLTYFSGRVPSKIYVSKVFPFPHFNSILTNNKRYIYKVFPKDSMHEFAELHGEIVLREGRLFRNKFQIRAAVYSHKNTNLLEFTLQKFNIEHQSNSAKPVSQTAFSFTQEEFTSILKFLSDLKFIDLSKVNTFQVKESELKNNPIAINLDLPDPTKVLVDKDIADIVKHLSDLGEDKKTEILEALKHTVLTKDDLNILTGRKAGLELFEKNFENKNFDEKDWQQFFKNNTWIFGYGLDYRFLNIIQPEATVSSVDVGGKNKVITDFLLADNNFTVIVELKRPDTKLFENKDRSESWALSRDLINAVSQILAQKAEW